MIDTHHQVHPPPPARRREASADRSVPAFQVLTSTQLRDTLPGTHTVPFPYQVATNTHSVSVGAAAHDRSLSAFGVIGARWVRPSRGRNIDLETVRKGQSGIVTTYPFCLLISVRTASLLVHSCECPGKVTSPRHNQFANLLAAAVPGWGGCDSPLPDGSLGPDPVVTFGPIVLRVVGGATERMEYHTVNRISGPLLQTHHHFFCFDFAVRNT